MKSGNKKGLTFARKSCVTATQVALAMMAAQAVHAQQAPSKPGERIEVTGSRIPLQQNVESTSPIAVISADDVKIEGVRNTENLLYNMPQVFADQGSTVANGASGTATVDLRNLGADRTLVLVNGRRLPAGSPTYYPTDLNQIPAPLINRVEILTGGASAIYGSDAVAGVVNFIMRNNFSGVQGEINYSFFNHQQNNPDGIQEVLAARAAGNPTQFRIPGDLDRGGESTDVALLMGDNFANGRGNATVFFGYKKDQALTQAEYDYSACSLARNSTGTGFACGGSGTSFPGQFVPLGPTGTAFTIANSAGGTRPFAGTDVFNFGPYNFYQRPSERYTAAAFTHYDVNPSMRVYHEFNFHDDHTVAQIAPSGLFGVIATLSGANPLLSDDLRTRLGLTAGDASSTRDVLILRRNIEGGGRQADLRHTSFRNVIGVKGDLFGTWDYDVFGQTGKVIYQQVYRNDFSATRGVRSLDIVADPATGLPVCRSALDGTDPNCVPYNIFTLGGVNQAALDYLQTPGLQTGETSQSVWGATLSTDLGNYGLKFPSAKSGIAFAVGAERRKEKLNLDTDTAFSTGDLSGQGGPTIGLNGKYEVKEFFGEVRLPILEGMPGADILSLNASYRYSDYDTGKKTDSYGFGVEYGPTRTIKLRASYQQAVRAANIIELFQARGTNLFDMDFDPCAGPTPARSAADCARTGVTAALFGSIPDNPAGQYNYLQGGNPLLEPETAKSYTLGLVLTPMRNLSATFDYYRIEVKDIISNLPPVSILNACLDTGQFCSLIHRDSLGSLWLAGSFIEATNQNLAKAETSGIDVAVNYNHPLGRWGGLGVNFVGTYLKEFISQDDPTTAEYDCAGLYGNVCLLPLPEWRHKLRFTWTTPWNVDVSATWRYYSEVKFDNSNPNNIGSPPPIDAVLEKQNYFDIAASWAITKQLTLRAGVNNLFDEDPPLTSQVGTTGNGNTYPQTYDAFGRRVFVNATIRF